MLCCACTQRPQLTSHAKLCRWPGQGGPHGRRDKTRMHGDAQSSYRRPVNNAAVQCLIHVFQKNILIQDLFPLYLCDGQWPHSYNLQMYRQGSQQNVAEGPSGSLASAGGTRQRERRTGEDDTVANPPDSTSATSTNPFASGSLLERKALLTFDSDLRPHSREQRPQRSLWIWNER